MSKTFKFDLSKRCAALKVMVCVSLCVAAASAQQGGTAPRSSPAPSTKVIGKPNVTETLIDSSIPPDPAVEQMLSSYRSKVHELDVKIGALDGDLRKGGVGGGSLGNFVADGMRVQAQKLLQEPMTVAITNSGGLRVNTINSGDLYIRNIFELLPFENKLVVVEVSGEQLLDALRSVVANRECQSGAIIRYGTDADKKSVLIGADLVDEHGKRSQINPVALYRVVTIDYLLNVGNGRFPTLQAAKTKSPVGITIRDALISYVKDEASAGRKVRARLDGRFSLIESAKEGRPE